MNNITLSLLLTTLWQSQSEIANQFNGYLVLGYLIMWLIAMIYIVSLASRQRNLQQDIQLMHQLLQDDEEVAE